MKRVCAVSTAAILGAVSLSAVAADQTYSTWAGGSGKWSDASHWSRGVPNNPNCQVYFETEGADYTVELDTDFEGTYFNVKTPAAGVEKGHTVRLTGSATITALGTGTSWEVQSGASLIWDGPTFVAKEGRSMSNNGSFEMRSGSFEQGNVIYSTTATSRFLMTGGYLWTQRLKISENVAASYTQTGGYFRTPSFEALVTEGVIQNPVSVTGGIFRRDQEVVIYENENIDWRLATNVVWRMFFKGGTTADKYPKYYGDCLVIDNALDHKNDAWGQYACFPHGITFGSIGDWHYSRRVHELFYERTWFDTADFFDPAVKHTVAWDFYQYVQPRVDIRVFGGGTFVLTFPDADSFPGFINNYEICDDTTMEMALETRAASALRKNHILTENFRVGRNARLTMEGAGFQKVSSTYEPEIAEGASIEVFNHSDQTLTAGTRYPILACASKALQANLPITLTGTVPEGWTLAYCGPCAWMWDGTLPTKDVTSDYEWYGGTDGYLSTPANWSKGVVPSKMASNKLVFNTLQGTITNDVDNLRLNQISCTTACGPFVFTGKPITIARDGKQRGSAAAVYFWSLNYPVVFDCDVSGPGNPFNVCAGSESTFTSVAFMKNLDVPYCLDVSGRILIGGEATVGGIWMDNYGSAHAPMVEVLDGAKLTVTNQLATYFDVAAFPKAAQVLRANAGGEIEFTGGEFVNTAACEHHVFGTMRFGIPVSTTADLGFYGQGNVFMKSVKSSGVASRVVLGERVKLYPESWQTVAEDNAAPVTLALRTWATLGATCDWTYGVAAGVTTATTAAERALTVPECETLWVDTQSPDDGLGRTVTFTDPIVAPGGYLVKKGAGTLVLASADNDLATSEVTVEGGTLTWTEPQTFGKFAVKPGADLLVGAKDGALLALDLGDQDLDVEGVGITLTEDAQDLAGFVWTTVATVGEGRTITGVPAAREGWKTRIVALDAGGQALQCKKRGGAVLLIR